MGTGISTMFRTNYTIVVERIDKEKWKLVSLEFDE